MRKNTSTTTKPSGTMAKKGELSKKGLWGRWKTRFFVLQAGMLLQFPSERYSEGKPSHIITLSDVTLCKADSVNGQEYSFALRRSSHKTIFLTADSEQEMMEWITAISPHVHAVNDEWSIKDDELEKEINAVCITNENGYFLGVNSIFCAMLGWNKEELLGKPCTVIMPPGIAAKHDAYMTNYLNTGIKRLIGKPRKLAVQKKSGSLLLCELCLGELIDPETNIKRFMVHLRPIVMAEKEKSKRQDQEMRVESDKEDSGAYTLSEKLSSSNRSMEVTASPKHKDSPKESSGHAIPVIPELADSGSKQKSRKTPRAKADKVEGKRKSKHLSVNDLGDMGAAEASGHDYPIKEQKNAVDPRKEKKEKGNRKLKKGGKRKSKTELMFDLFRAGGEDDEKPLMKKSLSLTTITEHQAEEARTESSSSPRGEEEDEDVHQFHPLIAKLEKALEEKIEIFKKESRKTLHSEMLELLYKLDELEAELKEVKRINVQENLQRKTAIEILLDPVNSTMEQLKAQITLDIRETKEEKLLFRMDSRATRSVVNFMIALGLPYLERTIGPIIKEVCEDQLLSYEVNARMVDASDDISINRLQLKSICEQFASAITSSIDEVPTQFAEVFRHVRDEVKARWEGSSYYLPIGGLFFLRFIGSAIVSPSHYGLLGGEPDFRPQRGLILVSKVLQNVVNTLKFGGDHELEGLNDFISTQGPAFEKFIDAILEKESVGSLQSGGSLLSPRTMLFKKQHSF